MTKLLKHLSISLPLILLLACSQQSEPDRIKTTIEDMQSDLEAGQLDDFLDAIDERFLLNQNQDKQWLRRVLAYHYLKKSQVETAITNIDVEWDEQKPDEASVSITAFAAKFADWTPEEGRAFRLETKWLKQSGDWTLYRVEWLNPPDGYRYY